MSGAPAATQHGADSTAAASPTLNGHHPNIPARLEAQSLLPVGAAEGSGMPMLGGLARGLDMCAFACLFTTCTTHILAHHARA